MLSEIIEARPLPNVSLHVVWIPMVPGDGPGAARRLGARFAGRGVHQYYDSRRAVGLALRKDAFPECLRRAIRATPADHPLRATLAEWAEAGGADEPLWDAVLFYPRGVTWGDRAPAPARWSKQVAFFGADAGPTTGSFFRNDCGRPPADSDWRREVRPGLNELLTPRADGPT